jgi:hypothetical protein
MCSSGEYLLYIIKLINFEKLINITENMLSDNVINLQLRPKYYAVQNTDSGYRPLAIKREGENCSYGVERM